MPSRLPLNDYAGTNLAGRRAAEKSSAGTVLGHARDQPFGEAQDRAGVLIVGAHQGRAGGQSLSGLKPSIGAIRS